jgi:3-hydroxyisobutyrate dehydrogenase-like beta-hydroxyacid dehydrogenase
MTTHSDPIGFIGIGAIGRPIAERLAAKHELVIYDSSPSARSEFPLRARMAQSAREVGSEAETVFACLPSIQAYGNAVLGTDGLIEGTRVQRFIHIGTTGPAFVREMSTRLLDKGVETLDAPVTGGPGKARDGTLTVIASGDRALYDFGAHLMRAFAARVIYTGPRAGMAQMLKLINNVLSAANLAMASELLVVGAKVGFSPDIVLEVLNAGTGQNSATLTKIPDHILPRTFDYGGRLEIVCKDLEMLLSETQSMNHPVPLSETVIKTYRDALKSEGSNSDMTTIICPMERAANVIVSRN